MGYFRNTEAKLKELLGQNPQYVRSQFPGMQMGLAQQAFNSRMPGSAQFGRNIQSSGASAFSNASKYATDASQLLGINAGIQGQTDEQFGNLQSQEMDWKKFGLQNLNQAYAANTQEDQYMNENNQLNYQNRVQLEGAIAANKYAKRRALWDTVAGIGNFGVSAASAFVGGGAGKGGGGGGNRAGGGASPMQGVNTNWNMNNRPMRRPGQ